MNWKNQLASIIGFTLLALAIIVYSTTKEDLNWGEVTIIILIALLIYIAFWGVYNWLHIQPKILQDKYEELYNRINITVDTLIRKQQFIEQKTLSLIEEKAENIWVITTTLENELKDKDLRQTVENNLTLGKKYTYFLPHPKHPFFKSVDRNIENFQRFDFYNKYQTQIYFIRLPLETQFLLEEVVIYNPEQPEIDNDETAGINGFTYYQNKENSDEQPLHMKIEGNFLKFLTTQLDSFLRDTSLRVAVEKILIRFSGELNSDQKVYLADLMKEKSIPNKTEHSKFIQSLDNLENSTSAIITESLRQHRG